MCAGREGSFLESSYKAIDPTYQVSDYIVWISVQVMCCAGNDASVSIINYASAFSYNTCPFGKQGFLAHKVWNVWISSTKKKH